MYLSVLSDFNETWVFSTDFRNKAQMSISIKIRPVRAELFYADGQKDMKKLTVAFRNFANARKNDYEYVQVLCHSAIK